MTDDGLCAIDINHEKKAIVDNASSNMIFTVAKTVLDKCVFKDETKGGVPLGGYISNVG